MTVPAFNWIESSPTSIAFDTGSDDPTKWAWHSGNVIDVLHVDDDRLVVGTETGGVWIVDANGLARPVSNDWVYPDVLCLHRRSPLAAIPMYFCGTAGGLYRTDDQAPYPLVAWLPVNLPPGVSAVHRMASIGNMIVIATDNGIWWVDYQAQPVVNWQQAQLRHINGNVAALTGAWSGLALTGQNEFAAGTLEKAPFDWVFSGTSVAAAPYSLIAGKLVGADLIFEKAVAGIPPADLNTIGYVTMASCAAEPSRVYAVTFHDETTTVGGVSTTSRTRVFHLLRSDDGGRNWVQLSDGMTGSTHASTINLRNMARDADAGGRIKSLSVHPTLKNRVAFAAYISFISDDGGNSWTGIGGDWAPPDGAGVSQGWSHKTNHVHVDHHMVCFAPEQGFPERVLIATDGGVFRAEDWRKPETFSSLHNRGLRTLQFYSPCAWRNFLGSIGATPDSRGLVAGGLQDNGNVWKADFAGAFWVPSEPSDGGHNMAVGADRYFHKNLDNKDDDPGAGAIRAKRWPGTGNLVALGNVPVRDAAGQLVVSFLETALEPVRNPTFRDSDGRTLYGLGWRKNIVYGLFGDDNADQCFWRQIAAFAPTEGAVTVSSFDGSEVLVASSTAAIYRVNTASGQITNMPINGVPLIPAGMTFQKPAIGRLVATGPASGFASFLDSPPSIARRQGDAWTKTASSPSDPFSPNSTIFGMDADDIDQSAPPVLLVATDARVWVSLNNGDNWSDVSQGLPKRPHCADLRFNRHKRRWMLGTYGRSMWQSGNVVQVGVSSLLQGDFLKGAEHKNFEALVLIGSELFHYFKDNNYVENRWIRTVRITDKATAPACLIRSNYVEGADHKNLEALVLEGNELSHWSRDNSVYETPWNRIGLVTDKATGPASMIQSDYFDDPDHGNYEALIPMADGLWHWYRNHNSGQWNKVAQLNSVPNSAGCLISSDYHNDGSHRALEALVYERPAGTATGYLFHYYWDPGQSKWIRTREVTDLALGPGCMIQGDYVKGKPHHNLEALAWQLEGGVPVLRHFFRRDDIGSLSWERGPIVATGVQGSASMIQGSFHQDADHGNFEAIFAALDNEIWHHWRQQTDLAWLPGGTVT
jgi:hypothetical protein